MAIVNGKVVLKRKKPLSKKSPMEKALSSDDDKATDVITRAKAASKKKLRDKALGIKEKEEHPIKKGFEKMKKEFMDDAAKALKKKKKNKEDFIRTGDHSALKIEQDEYNGEKIVAIRKMFCTKADPEMRIGRGGFNLPTDKDVLQSVIDALQEIHDDL